MAGGPRAGDLGGSDPHANQPVLWAGAAVERAKAAVVMIHGRGASAEDILSLHEVLDVPDVAYVAPQAAAGTWYPYSFLAPVQQNEPGISSAMRAVERVLEELAAGGVSLQNTILLGFSQGGCLASEYVARNARRYGGLACLSGGLIGPDTTPRDYPGLLEGTPAFLGCSDMDPHIPSARVRETGDVLLRMGAEVKLRLYHGMGHMVNEDEIAHVRENLASLVK
jgi:phospholipase/carboxylesterase